MAAFLRKLLRIFRDALLAPAEGNLLRRSLLNFLIAMIGGMAAASVAIGVASMAGFSPEELEAPSHRIGWMGFVTVVLLAPVIETFLLAGTLALLPVRWSLVRRAMSAGLIWGAVHGLAAPIWFFGPAVGFFVFACAYQVWRPVSFRHAFAAAALPHALNNAVALILLASLE